MTQLVVWRRAWNSKKWEEGRLTETMVSNRMARLCLRDVVGSETPLR